jgi:hypothetical protein
MNTNDLIGKRVRVEKAVKVCYMKELRDVVGILTFVGLNFEGDLHCTINRMPIAIKSVDQIKIIE